MIPLPPLLLAMACHPGGAPPEPITTGVLPVFVGERPTNLLVLSIDTLQRDRLAAYGGTVALPFLDGLLDGAVRLDRHSACSNWTFAAVLCVQTGLRATELGFVPGMGIDDRVAPDTFPDLPERLRRHGYASVLGTANPYFSPERGTARGFDRAIVLDDADALALHDAALPALLDETGGAPWYYHLHLMEPHIPYAPPDAYLDGLDALPDIRWDLEAAIDHYDVLARWITLSEAERELVAEHMAIRYDGELRWLDDQLAAIFQDLDDRGMIDDTLVVVWSDHGEQFWEHGAQSHGHALYGEETNALALLWAANTLPARHGGPTTHVDLAPTIFTALGLPLPPEWTGAPVGTAREDRAMFATTDARAGVITSIQSGDDRLHYWWSGGIAQFDLATDPGELTDVYDPLDPASAALWDALRQENEATAALVDAEPVPPPPPG